MKKYYRFSFKLNTSHSVNNDETNSHNHTFIIYLNISSLHKDSILEYEQIEACINEYFMRYTNVYLNKLPVFQDKLPTIEGIGEVFYEELKEILERAGASLLQLEIGETPVRFYIISNCILIPSQYGGDSLKNWEVLLERKKQLCNMGKDR